MCGAILRGISWARVGVAVWAVILRVCHGTYCVRGAKTRVKGGDMRRGDWGEETGTSGGGLPYEEQYERGPKGSTHITTFY
jgi:hypothetical protein